MLSFKSQNMFTLFIFAQVPRSSGSLLCCAKRCFNNFWMCLIFVACTFYETHLYIEGFSATQTIAKQTKQISRKCQLFLNEVHTSQSSALLVVSFFTFVFVAEIVIFSVEFFFHWNCIFLRWNRVILLKDTSLYTKKKRIDFVAFDSENLNVPKQTHSIA